ncbi:hypothetical protein DL95DRAFT_383926, partial [Leptodontidium sp. 2 PMI_412]
MISSRAFYISSSTFPGFLLVISSSLFVSFIIQHRIFLVNIHFCKHIIASAPILSYILSSHITSQQWT